MADSLAPFPFPGLTKAQQRVLGEIAVGQDGMHNPATLKVLVDRGLIVELIQETPMRVGVLRVKRYEMPIGAHIQWCEWCSATVTDEEIADLGK